MFQMNSVGAECNELKASYDACFNVWFAEKFLRQGQQQQKHSKPRTQREKHDDVEMCKPIFLVYKECVKKAIEAQNIDLKEVNRQVLGTDSEKKKPPEQQEQK